MKKTVLLAGLMACALITMAATSVLAQQTMEYQPMAAEAASPQKIVSSQALAEETDILPAIEMASPTKSKVAQGPVTKEAIYARLLESSDYYDTARGSFESTMGMNQAFTITYAVDLVNGTAYEQTLSPSGDEERYADGAKATLYNNKERTYLQQGIMRRSQFVRDDTPASQRIYVDEEGNKCYSYRAKPSNAPMADMSLSPQELTFGYLEDFSLWEITGTAQYLGRDCALIEGTAELGYGSKFDVDHFTFTVDINTGILLKYEGYNSQGQRTDYLITTEIEIDAPAVARSIRTYSADMSKYEGYTELTRE